MSKVNMGPDHQGYDGPNLHLVVTLVGTSDFSKKYQWQVTMRAADATGERKLGYRASGSFDGLNKLIFESGPEVHDESRPVWTPMNAKDRPDIRKRMQDLVLLANAKMRARGQNKFEHLERDAFRFAHSLSFENSWRIHRV